MNKQFGKIDALSITGEIQVPLVILLQKNLTQRKYIGFIPGLTKKDIEDFDLENCKKQLKELAHNLVKKMATENMPFPFFPTKDEILEDFENVCYISFINIKSSNRKN